MAAYSLALKRSAAKEIETIEPVATRRKIVARIGELATEPRPTGSEKLAGSEKGYRLRQGEYRVVYEIDDAFRRVTVVRVAHRREVYR